MFRFLRGHKLFVWFFFFFWTLVFNSFGYVPRITIVELYSRNMYSFAKKNLPSYLPECHYHFAFPPAINENFLLTLY